MQIDKAVDEAINEVIAKVETDVDEIKRRKPKPFRYLTDEEEIQREITTEKTVPFSVMRMYEESKMLESDECVAGLGDVEKIEKIIKKHEKSRRLRGI